MSSGDKKLNIVTKRVLGWQSFKDNLLDYLDDHDQDLITQVFKTSGVFTALTLAAAGTDNYAITGYGALGVVDGIDGQGNMLDLYSRKAYNDTVPFENITTNDYHVAIRKASLPQGVTVSQEDGQPNFDTYEEVVGWEADPDTVTDNGNGTITFQVDSVTESGVTNAGRTVAVYKKIPGLGALTEAVAVEILTVAWTGGQNKVTTASDFGQTTVSTTASDYRAVLLGPRTSRDTDLRPLSDWCFVGIVSGKTGSPPDTFDVSDQELIDIPFSDWSHIVRYESVPPDRLKVEVEALSGESGVDQIRVNHLGTGVTFKVDEAGNITTLGSLSMTAGSLSLSTDAGKGVATDIVPTANASKSLGNASYTWKQLYLSNAAGDGMGTDLVPKDSATQQLGISGRSWKKFFLSGAAGDGVGSNLVPDTIGTHNLGSTNYTWQKLFLSSASGKGVECQLVPSADNTYGLGNTNYQWKWLYVSDVAGSGVGANLVPSVNAATALGNASYAWLELHTSYLKPGSLTPGIIQAVAEFLPGADDTYDLGTSTAGSAGVKRWKIIQGMGIRACDASPGGFAGTNTFTADSSGVSTGTGTVKMNSTNAADSTGWIKIYVGTATKWIPFWDTNAP